VRVWISEMEDTDHMSAGEALADERARTALEERR
jgi:hypothetical protein